MNARDLSTAKDPDLRASQAALRRASALARKVAIQTDTDIVVVQDKQRLRSRVNVPRCRPMFAIVRTRPLAP